MDHAFFSYSHRGVSISCLQISRLKLGASYIYVQMFFSINTKQDQSLRPVY